MALTVVDDAEVAGARSASFYTPKEDPAAGGKDGPSQLGVAARGVVRSALPTAAGIVAGMGTTIASSPFITPVGGLVAGIPVGMAAGYGTAAAQQKFFEANPGIAEALGQSPEQVQADIAAYPKTALVSEFAPGFLAFRPSTAAFRGAAGKSPEAVAAIRAARVQAGVGAGVGAGTDIAAQKLVEKRKDLDLTRLGVATTAGLLMQKPTAVGERLINVSRKPIPNSVLAKYDAMMAPQAAPAASAGAGARGLPVEPAVRRGQTYDIFPEDLAASRQDPESIQRLADLRARLANDPVFAARYRGEETPGAIPTDALARPQDPNQRGIFDDTPTALVDSDFSPSAIISKLRSYGAPSTTKGKGTDDLVLRNFATSLGELITSRDNGAAATKFVTGRLKRVEKNLASLEDDFLNGVVDDAQYAKRLIKLKKDQKLLSAADRLMGDFRTTLDTAQKAETDIAVNRAADEFTRQQEALTRQEQARKEVLGEYDLARFAEDERTQILNEVLADPDTMDAGNRFRAALRAAGMRDVAVLPEEAARIARFEELRDTFDSPFELTGSPEEDGNIVLRGEPPERRAALPPAPEPSPGQGKLLDSAGRPTQRAMGTTPAQRNNPANFSLEPSGHVPVPPERRAPVPPAPEPNPGQGKLFTQKGQPTQQAMKNTESAPQRTPRQPAPAPAGDEFSLTSPTPEDFAVPGDRRAEPPVREPNPAQGEMFTKRGDPTKQAMGVSKQQLVNEANSLLNELKGKKARATMQRALDAFMRNEIDMPRVREVHSLLKARRFGEADKALKNLGDGPVEPPEPPPPPPPPAGRPPRAPRKAASDPAPAATATPKSSDPAVSAFRQAVDDLYDAQVIPDTLRDRLHAELDKETPNFDMVGKTIQFQSKEAERRGIKIGGQKTDTEAQDALNAVAKRRAEIEAEQKRQQKSEEDDDADPPTPPEPKRTSLLRELRSAATNKEKSTTALDRISRKLGLVTEKPAESEPGAESDPNAPAYESTEIKSRPGVNAKRMAKMLGPQLYGDMQSMGKTSVKEVLQNSFDAVRTAMRNGQIKQGRIDIEATGREITMTDNGVGMSPELLGTKFLEIAGTGKSGDGDSGGFGIAKMLFLYGNDNLRVISMRDGKVAEMETTGQRLFDALEDQSQAPMVRVRDPDASDLRMFPDGHGTQIRMKLPDSYTDADGNVQSIREVRYIHHLDSLIRSPLFQDVDVTFNGDPVQNVGSRFNPNDYTQFANIKFQWGRARVYVTKKSREMWDDNLHVLSNGLHQFSESAKNGGSWNSKRIPYEFYVDLQPTVKPDEPGYPFTFNRQSLTAQAAPDLGKVLSYIKAMYAYENLAADASDFGEARYFDPDTFELSDPVLLKPENPATASTFKSFGPNDVVTVEDGQLMVNGRELPELTPDELKAGVPSTDELMMDPSLVKTDRVMLHDNTDVYNRVTDERTPLPEYMRNKFGAKRFDDFQSLVGETFFLFREMTANVLGYPDLLKEAIGLSYDPGYRGVSIRVPMSGSFLNPIAAESAVPKEAGYGLVGTMIHELAHHKVRSHDADFPAEMQRILFKLRANSEFNTLESGFAELVSSRYPDILTFGHKLFQDTFNGSGDLRLESRGKRFRDSREDAQPPRGSERDAEGDGGSPEEGGGAERLLGAAAESSRPAGSGRGGQGPTPPVPGGGQRGGVGGRGPTIGNNTRTRTQALNDPRNFDTTAADWWTNTKGTGRRALLKGMGQRWMTEKYRDKLPELDKWLDLLVTKSTAAQAITQKAARVHGTWKALPPDQAAEVGRLLLDASKEKADLTDMNGSGPLYDRYYAMSREAQDTYDAVRATYDDHFNQAKSIMQQFIKDSDMTPEEQAEAINELNQKFKQSKGYFPFERFGDWVTIAESADLADLRQQITTELEASKSLTGDEQKAALKSINNLRKQVRKMEANEDQYMVMAFEDEASMRNEAQALRDEGYVVREKLASDFDASVDVVSSTFMRKVNDSLNNMASMNPDAAKGILGMKSMLNQMYLSMMPEGSPLKRQLSRRNIAGQSEDAQRVFAATTRRNASYLSELQNGHQVRRVLEEMRTRVRNQPIEMQEVYNQLKRHYDQLQTAASTPIQDALASATYAYMLGSNPSFTLLQLMQTPMVAVPLLAGKNSMPKATKALTVAGKDVLDTFGDTFEPGNEFKAGKTDDEQNMLRYMMSRNALSATEAADFVAAGQASTPVKKAAQVTMKVASFLPHHAERFNRLTTALAAYRLALKNPKIKTEVSDGIYRQYMADHPDIKLTKEQFAAAQYAEKMLTDAHVDFAQETQPYFMQRGVIFGSRLMFQFMKYQYGMFKILAQNASDMIDKSLPPEDRWGATRTFGSMLATHQVLSLIHI